VIEPARRTSREVQSQAREPSGRVGAGDLEVDVFADQREALLAADVVRIGVEQLGDR
jgi:hypothetical protein